MMTQETQEALTSIVERNGPSVEIKKAIQRELAARLLMSANRDVASIARLLMQVTEEIDEVTAAPDQKTPEQKEADEVSAAREARARKKSTGAVVGRKGVAK